MKYIIDFLSCVHGHLKKELLNMNFDVPINAIVKDMPLKY